MSENTKVERELDQSGKATPLSTDELAAIEIPEFDRQFVKSQPMYVGGEVHDKEGKVVAGRTFSASGPKADLCVKYIIHGGFTRQEIATYVGCSVSRVGEVLWAMDNANVEHPEITRRRSSTVPAVTSDPPADPETGEDEDNEESEADEAAHVS